MNNTAVEWLKDVMFAYLNKADKEYTDKVFEYALALEKQQIIDAHCAGQQYDDISAQREAIIYYKNTYE